MTIVQQQFPNIDFPTITVRASYPGGSTTEIRDAVVRPIEDAIAGAPDLDHINTTVQQGQATISAVFSLNSNKTTDLVQVQRRLLVAQSQLPSDMPARPSAPSIPRKRRSSRSASARHRLRRASFRRSSPTISCRISSKSTASRTSTSEDW